MNTERSIDSWVHELRPSQLRSIQLRVIVVLSVGSMVALAAVLAILGTRADLGTAVGSVPFWMKWAYTLSLGSIAGRMTLQLARPGAALASVGWLFVPGLALGSVAVAELTDSSLIGWRQLWLGHSAPYCSVCIVVLTVPLFVSSCIGLRAMAPTRLRLTGALAALTAAAFAATIYSLACDETSASFILSWYSLGIGLPTALGAVIGPRILRW